MLREELIIFKRGLIVSGTICLNKHVGKGSSTHVDDFSEKLVKLVRSHKRGVKHSNC